MISQTLNTSLSSSTYMFTLTPAGSVAALGIIKLDHYDLKKSTAHEKKA